MLSGRVRVMAGPKGWLIGATQLRAGKAAPDLAPPGSLDGIQSKAARTVKGKPWSISGNRPTARMLGWEEATLGVSTIMKETDLPHQPWLPGPGGRSGSTCASPAKGGLLSAGPSRRRQRYKPLAAFSLCWIHVCWHGAVHGGGAAYVFERRSCSSSLSG